MPAGISSRWTVIPQRRSSDASATRRAYTLIFSVITLILLLLAILGMLLAGVFSKTVDLSTVDPQGRGVADAVAEQTVGNSSAKIKIPTAESLDETALAAPVPEAMSQNLPYKVKSMEWIGFKTDAFQGAADQATQFEIHQYLLVPDLSEFMSQAEKAKEELAANGGVNENANDPADSSKTEQEIIQTNGIKPYVLEVPVLMTADGPRQAGAAALAPWSESEAEKTGVADYSDYSTLRAEANSQTAKQIGRWAVAYAENDMATLLELTGDTDTSHAYEGLGGFKVPQGTASVQILSTISVNDGDQVVRVRVLLEDTRVAAATETEGSYRTYTDYDLLITGPDSASPKVAAWGAAGTAGSLVPGYNAIKK